MHAFLSKKAARSKGLRQSPVQPTASTVRATGWHGSRPRQGKTEVAATRRRGLNSGRECSHTFTPDSSPLLYIAQQFTGSPWVIKCTPFYPKKRQEAKRSARAQYNPPLAPSELLDRTARQDRGRGQTLQRYEQWARAFSHLHTRQLTSLIYSTTVYW